MTSRWAWLWLALVGCGTQSATAPDLLEPDKAGDVFDGVQCSTVRPPTEPDLMGWDSGSRLRLKTLHERGVVAVRYRAEGCNVELEVLNCVGEGEYTFSPYSANETKLANSKRDLFAELPIGAAKLGGRMGGGRSIRTDYMLAGALTLPVMEAYPADKLRGNGCDRATHVVSSLYVGGFAMAAGQSEMLATSASFFGVGAGGEQNRSAERIASEGNAQACERAQQEGQQEPLCSVPLRVGLAPIAGRVAGSCPAGTKFETGRGCVSLVASRPSPPASPRPAPASPQPAPASPRPAPTASSGTCPSGMAWIAGGTFQMGSNDGDARDDEKPVHPVTLSGFCLDKTEVTVSAYASCVSAGKCKAPGSGSKYCNDSSKGSHPRNCVSWQDAVSYCEWKNKKLPTEAQWEYAARGGGKQWKYAWGNAAPSASNACWNRWESKEGTCAVRSFPSGAFGLYDMSGNVWEWTADWHATYPSSSRTNPTGPMSGSGRVIRGGGWGDRGPAGLRGASRTGDTPGGRSGDLGFRCARTP